MANPTPGSLRDLKKVARYLLGTKHMALLFVSSEFSKQHLDLRGQRLRWMSFDP